MIYYEAHFSYGEMTAIVRCMTEETRNTERDQGLHEHVLSFLESHDLTNESYAVAVSGGPDSMALAHMLYSVRAENNHQGTLHVLTVDHGLRAAAKDESQAVKEYFDGKPDVVVEILVREISAEDKNVRVQETARNDRYELMAEYCKAHDLCYLFLAHHANDQMETILFRLAKGSGLDGLSGIKAWQDYNDDLILARPFLALEKEGLLAYCNQNEILFFEDVSNDNTAYARTRMRKTQNVLENEGFSAQRLGVLAHRLDRAKKALEFYTDKLHEEALTEKVSGRIVFAFSVIKDAPEEVRIRLFQKAFDNFAKPTQPYGPRREKLERLVTDLFASPETFQRRSLGACYVSLSKDGANIVIEHAET